MRETFRLKKFNNGNGAILCNGCRVIIKEGFGDLPYQISKADWESKEPIFCKKCQEKQNASVRTESGLRLPTGREGDGGNSGTVEG